MSRGPWGAAAVLGPGKGGVGCGRDDNRLKSRLRKGQREVEGVHAGSAGLKGGAPPSELEGVSCPRTVTSHQGRSGQEPSAWSCPPSACLGEAPAETTELGHL